MLAIDADDRALDAHLTHSTCNRVDATTLRHRRGFERATRGDHRRRAAHGSERCDRTCSPMARRLAIATRREGMCADYDT